VVRVVDGFRQRLAVAAKIVVWTVAALDEKRGGKSQQNKHLVVKVDQAERERETKYEQTE
jgi:hypothetical protein